MFKRIVGYLLPLGLAPLLFAGAAVGQTDQEKVVSAADVTMANFLRDPEMTWLQENFSKAKGVLIAPKVVKAGFVFGGSGGHAVLIARDPKSGKWAGPVFYTMATASVGFQAGVAVSEVMTLVMTDKGMRSLLATSVKLGPDASVAAGPVGAGVKADVVTDMVSYSRAKGLYGGVNLDGTVVTVADKWNEAYYKKPVQPADVLVSMSVRSPKAAKLLGDASKAGSKK